MPRPPSRFAAPALMLLAAAALVAADVGQYGYRAAQVAPSGPPMLEMGVTLAGDSVNASDAFLDILDDAVAKSSDFLSVADMDQHVVRYDTCGRVGAEDGPAPKPAPEPVPPAAPPPPPQPPGRRLAADPCVPSVQVAVSVHTNRSVSEASFAQLRSAIEGGTLADYLSAAGIPVARVALTSFITSPNPASPPPPPNTAGQQSNPGGRDVVRFVLRVLGNDAVIGNKPLLRALQDMITDQLTSGAIDYVNSQNTRIVSVETHMCTHDNCANIQVGDDGGVGRRRLAGAISRPPRRALLLLEGAQPAPAPGAPPDPETSAAGASNAADARLRAVVAGNGSDADLRFDFAPKPAIDVTFETDDVNRAGASQIRSDLITLATTNQLTKFMLLSGFDINAVQNVPRANWFTVNGIAWGANSDGAPPASTSPAVVAVAAVVPVLLGGTVAVGLAVWWRRRAARAGGGPSKGAGSAPLDAAVAAAAKSGAAPSAAALLLAPRGAPDGLEHLAHDWQLDPAALRVLTRPDGREWELGSGASARVYKALYNGVQEVAVKVFTERLVAAPGDGGGMAGADGGAEGAAASSGDVEAAAVTPTAGGRVRRLLKLGSSAAAQPPRSSGCTDDTAAAGQGRKAGHKAGRESGGSEGRTEGGAGPGSSGQPLASSGAATPAGGRSARRATDQLEDLAREILVLRACHDRNIVAFVGASLQAGHAVLVTEYMPNGDLLGAIESDTFGRFAWARRAGPGGRPVPGTGMNRRIALDVARGLHFLHSRRVVHLDLKSANVLLARDWTAKVADVGMSKILRTRFLSSLIGVGTFAWAAPEVLLGQPTAESADVYSFGVILWELSTNEQPQGRCLRALRPGEAPPEVAALMDRCLAQDPASRPTALELVHFFVDLGSASGAGRAGDGGGVARAEATPRAVDDDAGGAATPVAAGTPAANPSSAAAPASQSASAPARKPWASPFGASPFGGVDGSAPPQPVRPATSGFAAAAQKPFTPVSSGVPQSPPGPE